MKESSTAYLFWLLGVHRFYLGKPKTGLLQLLTLGGLGVWWIIDFLLIPDMVADHNKKHFNNLGN